MESNTTPKARPNQMEKRHDAKRILEEPKKRAVFIDLDGTLWDRTEVPASAWRAIETARENGHLIFVNTGRRHVDIPQFLWNAGFDGYCLATGMQLYKGKQLIRSSYMDPAKVRAIVEYLQSQDCGYGLEGNDIGFDDPKYAFRRKIFFEKERRREPSVRKPLSAMEPEMLGHIVKIIFDSDRIFELEKEAASMGMDVLQYKNKYNPSANIGSFFRGELTDDRHNKALAMDEILQAMRLKREDYVVAAIGDSENDIPMMKAADLAVCMGNGTASTKQAADFVSTSIHEDGLYNAFKWLKLLDE